MSIQLGRRLLASGAVRLNDVRTALLLHVTARTPLVTALLELGGLTVEVLEQELVASGAPVLERVEPVASLVDELPHDLCRTLLAVPVRRDERTGAVDVAAVDPFDPQIPAEFAFQMQSQIRVLRARFGAIMEALRRIDGGEYSSRVILQRAPSSGRRSPESPALAAAEGADPAAGAALDGQSAGTSGDPHAGPNGAGSAARTSTLPPQRTSDPIPLLRRRRRRSSAPPPGDRSGRGSEPPGADPLLAASPHPGSLRPPAVPRFDSGEQGRAPPPSALARGSAVAQPETVRGPFSPAAPHAPFEDIDRYMAGLRAATSRQRTVELLLAGTATVAGRVALFAVRKIELCGHLCNEAFGDPDRFRLVKLPISAPSILSDAIAEGIYLGPLGSREADAKLLRFMVTATSDVVAAPVRIVGKPALVLVADELGDTLIGTKRIEDLARAAGHALARILHSEKTGRL